MKRSHEAGAGVDSAEERGKAFESLWERAGACFFRHDLQGCAKGYVRGLLGRIERKNGRQMAEYMGDARPHPVRRLLDRKGPRLYDWAAAQFGAPNDGGLRRWVLFRRCLGKKPGERACCLRLAPVDAALAYFGKSGRPPMGYRGRFEAAKQKT